MERYACQVHGNSFGIVMTRDNAVMYYVTQVDTIEVQVRRGNVIE